MKYLILLAFAGFSLTSFASGPAEIVSIQKNIYLVSNQILSETVKNDSYGHNSESPAYGLNYEGAQIDVCLTYYTGWEELSICSKKYDRDMTRLSLVDSLLQKSLTYIHYNSTKESNPGAYIGVLVGLSGASILEEGFDMEDLVKIYEDPKYNLNLKRK